MLKPIKNLLVNQPILSYTIFFASAILLLFPGDKTPNDLPSIPFLDKIIHICIFGACAFALYFDFIIKKRVRQPLLPVLLFTYALLFFGGMVEVLQELFLNRTGSTDDFVADWVGLIIGFIIAHFFSPRLFNWLSKV